MKNVVITGSTRGIGLAMAREFLKAGEDYTDNVINTNIAGIIFGSKGAAVGNFT